MKTVALVVNHVLIASFGVASGGFKLAGGQADLDVFAHLGMGRVAVAAFGAAQLVAALATVWKRSRVAAAWSLAACNALATAGLFAAGVQPLAVISLVFIAMAVGVTRRT